jgi:hypothetical protein
MRGLRSVVVDDSDDDDSSNFRPIEPTVVAKRRRLQRLENESARVIEIDGELSGAITLELMTPRGRELPHLVEASCRAELVQSTAEHLARPFTEHLLA